MIDAAKAIYGSTGPSTLLGNGHGEAKEHHLGKVDPRVVLPPDHRLGMRVPKGGSSCAKCEYLASPTTCGNHGFILWNNGPALPHPADEYCCDLFETANGDEEAPT